jgi:hypothetical protein
MKTSTAYTGRRLNTLTRFGYEVRTNLTEADLTTMFSSEEKLLSYFKNVGTPAGEKTGTVKKNEPRYRIQEMLRFGNEPWLDEAACRRTEVEFTPIIDFQRLPYRVIMNRDDGVISEVMACMWVCANCPVSTQCFTRSLQERTTGGAGEAGVWAGTVEPQRRSFIRMRRTSREAMSTIRMRMNGDETTPVDPDMLVCTRCLRPAGTDAHHIKPAHDTACPGAVTGITASDVIKAIFEPIEQKMVRVI